MDKKKQRNNWPWIIGILIFLFLLSYIFSGILSLFLGASEIKSGNVAVIPIKGIILTEKSTDIFNEGIADSTTIVSDIEDASENPAIKAIIFEINSPGGAPVATDEIASAIEQSNKTTVAWIRETGASGAYWIASASEYIIANRMSITGSIGVLGSYLDVSGFLDDWNVTYEKLVGGRYKDVGTPLRKLSDEERRLLQKKIDLLHQEFKDAVQKNRKLSNSQTENVGQGEFYLGSEARNLGLVDELGGEKEAISYIEKKLNITAEIVTYEHKETLLDILSKLINDRSYFFGLGMADGMKGNSVGMFN